MDTRTFDEKNHEWNTQFYDYIQKITAVGVENRNELLETLGWVYIDAKSLEVDHQGLYKGIEKFRKSYIPEKNSDIGKLASHITKKCETIDGRVDLEKLQRRMNLLQDKGFLNVFGENPDVPTQVNNYVMEYGHITQKRKAEETNIKIASKVVLSTLAVIFLFYVAYTVYGKPAKPKQTPVTTAHLLVKNEIKRQELPVRLRIPKIDVNTVIEHVELTSGGEMGVPSNTSNVGWFDLGPRPGERGSAVIDGHFDGKHGEAGVFANLNKLVEGDKLYIEDDQGRSITFVVREKRIYFPGYVEDVFRPSEGAYLNLITCDGVWEGAEKSYSKRLVVFADIM